MLKLDIHKDIVKELQAMDRKRAGQVALKLVGLLTNPYPQDAEKLSGTRGNYLRTDIGEYRIIYTVEHELLRVVLIGKRNDDDIYRKLRHKNL